MYNKLGVDTYVFNGGMFEDFSGGAWVKEELTKSELNNGIMFAPNSNVTYDEFLNMPNEVFCVTMINNDGVMKSWVDLDHASVMKIIIENKNNLHDNNYEYLTIFNMKDGISLDEYELEIKQ